MIGNPESRGWSQIAWRPVARKGLTILLINALLVGQVPAPLWAQEALAGDVTAEASDESVPSAGVAPDVVVERVSSDATEPATAVEESKTIELSRVEMHRAGKKISADVEPCSLRETRSRRLPSRAAALPTAHRMARLLPRA